MTTQKKEKRPHQGNRNNAAWRWGVVAAAAGLFCLSLILVGAHTPRFDTCRVVARRVVAEKADAKGRQSYLFAVAVAPADDHDGRSDARDNDGIGSVFNIDDEDDDDDTKESTAHVSASWVDAAELDALWHRWRPGAKVSCTDGRVALSILAATIGTQHSERSDAGDGPRIAALSAAAAALALVLGCGVVACACKTRWCIEHCRPRRATHLHGSLWGDDDTRHGHRLVDSVFG
nr:hypothetical protein [Pandoravirus aubagnensis]